MSSRRALLAFVSVSLVLLGTPAALVAAAPQPPAPESATATPEPPAAPGSAAPVAPAPDPAAPADQNTFVPDDSKPKAAPKLKPVAAPAGSTTVTIRDFSFGPASVTVTAGDTVSWTNDGPTDHTATGKGFDTGLLKKGESGSHRFAQAGTFPYICSIHPNMKGTVKVTAASSSGGGSSSGSGSSGSGSSSSSGSASSGSGSASSTGSSGTSSGTGSSSGGRELPNTGVDAGGMLMVGLGLAGLGAALRRRTAA